MKPGVLGTIIGAAIGIAAAWSCTVDRPSETLKCSSQPDCTHIPGTICQSGYCIKGTLPADARELDAFVCPAVCGSCDTSATPTVCNINGTGTGNITCPAGYKCNISCVTPGSCGAINCSNAASCDVDCLSGSACLAITCQTKNCDVTCTGQNACGNISCTTGNCIAACTGSDACGTLQCTTGNCTENCMGGGGQQVCDNLQCSGSGACSRTCAGSAACANMSCNGGTCTETCSGGANACGKITNCGTGKCTATCQGADGACDDISCGNSCQCDVTCDLATNVCPNTMTCPDPNGGQVDECADTFGTCDSSQNTTRCRKCQ